jgi:putative flippase GtrA
MRKGPNAYRRDVQNSPPTSAAVGGLGGPVDPDPGGVRHRGARPSLITALSSSVVARFASVGVVNTLVDFGLFLGLVAVGTSAVPANTLSTAAGMAVSFLGNRRFVFGGTGNRFRELALFVLVCGTGIWLIQPLVIVSLTSALAALWAGPEVVVAAIAKLGGILVAAVWNFALYGRLVFRTATETEKGLSPS